MLKKLMPLIACLLGNLHRLLHPCYVITYKMTLYSYFFKSVVKRMGQWCDYSNHARVHSVSGHILDRINYQTDLRIETCIT